MCEWTIQWKYLKYFIITENTLCSIASCFVSPHVVISIPCSHAHISRVRIVVFKYCYSANSFYQVIPGHTRSYQYVHSTINSTLHVYLRSHFSSMFQVNSLHIFQSIYYCMWSSPTPVTCVLAMPSLSGPVLMLLVRMSYCIKES